jgi:hypothetical protein
VDFAMVADAGMSRGRGDRDGRGPAHRTRGVPSPVPTPSQPFAQRKVIGAPTSEMTLWNPPSLMKVTVSPTRASTLEGVNTSPDPPTWTTWSAAWAYVANASSDAAASREGRMRMVVLLVCPTLAGTLT